MEYNQQDNGSEIVFQRFCAANPDYFNHRSVGCRDLRTTGFCKKLGLNAYFSRCLTLTLPLRKTGPRQTQVFISVFPQIYDIVVQQCREHGIVNFETHSAVVSLEKYRTDDYKSVAQHDFMPDCEQYLATFRDNARLVITDRIHVAAPCIAMGIPVIVIKRAENDPRYDIFNGIIKCYSEQELRSGKIDFNVSAVDIEPLKALMRENLKLTIMGEVYGEHVSKSRLRHIRNQIANFTVTEEE